MKKEYTLLRIHTRRETKEVTGTIEYLTEYFGYTLEVGYSCNSKINTKPKTIKSLVTNLNKSFYEKECNCYERTFIELKGK